MDNITIRKATVGDTNNLTVLKQQVWIATYATEGIRTEFSTYVLTTYTPRNVSKQLRSNHVITLVAEYNRHLIGCIEVDLQPNNAPSEVYEFPEITVLYVLERFCGMKVGEKLLIEAMSILRSKGYSQTWLSVLHSNSRALRFYQKHLFTDVGTLYFEMDGNRYENRIMQRII